MSNRKVDFDQTFYQPSAPAPTGSSLLNAQEFNALNGILEHITDEAQFEDIFNDPKLIGLGVWADDEPQFPTQSSNQLQGYLSSALHAPNNINDLGNNISPTLSSGVIQQPSPPHPIIVNPFNDAHGLLPPNQVSQTAPEVAALNTLAWGSDPHFANSGYHPPQPPVTTDQEIQRKVLSVLIDDSAGDTAANSPVEIKYEGIGEDLGNCDMANNMRSENTQSPTSSGNQGMGLKRRAEDDEDHQQQQRRVRNRKESSNEPAPKKRGGKRDQLTEQEKRANHIHSEQKRRNQIKHGFDTLTEMVPELKGGGYSKSAVLQHSAVYVANLKGGNARLREILRVLEERPPAVGHGHGHGSGRGRQL